MREAPRSHVISVLQLGTLDYGTALRLQERLVALRKEGRIGDVVLLLEHTPVITLGRNAKAANILASPELLSQRRVEVFDCDRGGDVTFHGPGQLVAYPIFDLRGFPSPDPHRGSLGVVEFMRCLEEVLIRTCAEFGVPAKRIPGLTGVWTGEDEPETGDGAHFSTEAKRAAPDALVRWRDRADEGVRTHMGVNGSSKREAKIAALGVHISRGVTSHGIALNVSTDLSYFDLIVPCGITSKPVTSMAEKLNRELPMTDVAHALSRNFGVVFNRQILWLDSLDALLGTNLGIPMKVPENLRKMHGKDESALA